MHSIYAFFARVGARLRRIHPLALAAFLVALLVPSVAFAQDAAPAQVTALTPSAITIALIAAALAFLTNAWNTGSILGLKTVPAAVLPYIGVGLPFLGAVYTSLPKVDAITWTAVLNAVLAGFFALFGSASGAGAHRSLSAHFVAHKMARMVAKGLVTLLVLGGLAVGASACSGSLLSQIGDTVLKDVENGSALATIEGAIVAIDPALAGLAGAVDAIIQEVVDLLEKEGVIPQENVEAADAIKMQAAVKVDAVKKAGAWNPSPHVREVLGAPPKAICDAVARATRRGAHYALALSARRGDL